MANQLTISYIRSHQPERGFIKINGKYLQESTTNVGYMLQHDELFEWRTIYHNVLLGLEVQHMLTAQTRARAHDLLDQYGLSRFETSHPSELSGGMRQRAALVRTLVMEPDLLLLDEPSRRWIIKQDLPQGMTSDRFSEKRRSLQS